MAHFKGSGAAENETYFTYMCVHHPDKMIIRQLKWENVPSYNPSYINKYDFVSIHWYMRH